MSETTPGRLESSLAGRDGRDGDGALAAGPAPPPAPALARALAVVTRRTCFATWEPRRRTHLLCVLCAGLLTYASYGAMYPLRTEWLWYELAGGIGLGLLSVWPLIGSALNLLVTCVFYATVPGGDPFPLPIMGPWLCAAVLLTRGFNRLMAYGLVAVSTTVELFSRMTSPGYAEDQDVQPALMLGVVCLIIAELMRRPRQQADAVADRYRADLERQRLLVVSELHDTVVRDLTQAVMLAEQARLAQPDAVLGRDLAALTASVRTSVEQLRSSLRAMSDAGGRTGAQGLDVLASSAAPRGDRRGAGGTGAAADHAGDRGAGDARRRGREPGRAPAARARARRAGGQHGEVRGARKRADRRRQRRPDPGGDGDQRHQPEQCH